MKRRQFITSAVSAGTVSLLAGCAGGGDSGGSTEGQDATPTETPTPTPTPTETASASEEWQRQLERCTNSEAKIAVRDIRVEADGDEGYGDDKILVVIENLDIVSLNIVDVSVTFNPGSNDEDRERRYWDKEERTLDGEDLQSYTIDASYSRDAFSGTTWGIGSRGELLYVNVYTADNPDISSGGTRICWKPGDS